LNRKILVAGIATGTTLLSLVFAERVVGPRVRAIFGMPFGFQEHFFSPMAYRQALLTQVGSTSIAFFILGIALGRKAQGVSYAVWAANPITVGVGFIAWKALCHLLHVADCAADYDNPRTLLLFCVVAPFVFASCFYAGSFLLRPRHKLPAVSSW